MSYHNESLGQLWASRRQVKNEADELLSKAERRGRDLTRNERREFDDLVEEIEEIDNEIEERVGSGGGSDIGRKAFMDSDAPAVHEQRGNAMNRDNESLLTGDAREEFDAFCRGRTDGTTPETREAQQSIGVAAEGGVFASTVLASEFLRVQQQFGGVRDTRARQIRTPTGEAMNHPFVDDVGESAEQAAENSTVSNVNRIDFGDVALQAHTFDSGVVTVSREQVQDSAFDISNVVTRTLANRIGRAVEPDLAGSTVTTSTAINGVITLSTGAETVAAGSTNLSIGNLRNLYFSVDPVFRSQGEWVVSDSAMQAIADLEDADGDPLVTDNWRQGEPPQLLGQPIRKVIGMGDINASTEFPILFGDLRQGYVVRDVMRTEIIRYDEKFMPSRRIGFQAFQRVDGRPLLSSTVASTNRPYRAIRTT